MTDIEYEEQLWGKLGVYCWTSPSEKRYVGYSDNLGSRHKDFRCASKSRTYTGTHSHVDYAREKYPYSEWKYEILEECSKEMLGEREQYWIDFYNTTDRRYGYNITKGGRGGNGVPKSAFKKGHETTEEQKRKRVETLRKHVAEGAIDYKYKQSKTAVYDLEGNLVKRFDSVKETNEFLGITGGKFDGKYIVKKKYQVLCETYFPDLPDKIEPYQKKKRTFSEEVKEKMSVAKKGKPLTRLYKPVNALDDEGNIVYRFESVKAAAEFVCPGNPKSAAKAITMCINKRGGYDSYGNYHVRKHSNGYRWEHA